ncbi:MAG: NUDIX domain-containing protein [Anaerolineae bacterium]|nr:NUDIX domain-containing protein [Anaerolineae bacterium]
MFGDRDEKRKQWDVGVGAALVHEGAVLLVRQTYGWAKGKWVLPGGFANHDELLDEAAVRELREEAGVEGAPLGVIGVRTRYRAKWRRGLCGVQDAAGARRAAGRQLRGGCGAFLH